MKKYLILLLLSLPFFIASEENYKLTEKKINESLSVSKYTRDIAIGLLTPGTLFTLSSIPLFAYYDYSNSTFTDSYYNENTYSYEYYNEFNTNEILSYAISSLSCGLFFSLSSATLFIFSKIYEEKVNTLFNQLPVEKRQNIRKKIPNHLKIWDIDKKLAITGTLLLIYGSLSLTGGIVELIAMYLIKIEFENFSNIIRELYDKQYRRDSESDINKMIGKYQNLTSISTLLTIGSILEVSGIIFFIASAVEKNKKKMYKKYQISNLSPILDLNSNYAVLGINIKF